MSAGGHIPETQALYHTRGLARCQLVSTQPALHSCPLHARGARDGAGARERYYRTMATASWNGTVVAEEKDPARIVLVDGNVYFLPEALQMPFFQDSSHTYVERVRLDARCVRCLRCVLTAACFRRCCAPRV